MNWLAEPNRCPGLFYGTPAQDGYLIRIRTPGGWLNPQQGRAIAALSRQWDDAAVQVTNRANLQVRAVQAAPTSEVLQTLQSLGLAAENPKVDHLRNLMSSPTAGIDPQELIDTRPLVRSLDTYIQCHPELAALPAKFSIGIDGGGAVGIGDRSAMSWEHRYNEIQLSAVGEWGIGGGQWGMGNGQWAMGNGQWKGNPTPHSPLPTPHSPLPTPHPPPPISFRLALAADRQLCHTQVLIAPEDCLSVVAALAAVYLDYVNAHTQARKKPRMKHLLQDWGMEGYLQEVNRQLLHPLHPATNCPMLPPTQRYGYLGAHPQRQARLSYVGVSLRLGQLTAAQLLGLVQLSETFGSGDLRLTPWQTVLLPDIPDEQVPDLLQNLSALELSAAADRADAAIVACAGKPGCAAAATQTQTHAIELADYLNQQLTLERPVNIHLTGCKKFCAQPSSAEITLLGTTIEKNGEMIEGYQVYVGDNKIGNNQVNNHQHSSAFQVYEVSSAELPALIEQLLHLYQHHRETPDESFGEFTSRVGCGEINNFIPLFVHSNRRE